MKTFIIISILILIILLFYLVVILFAIWRSILGYTKLFASYGNYITDNLKTVKENIRINEELIKSTNKLERGISSLIKKLDKDA